MPLSKPYPPDEIAYQDWDDLAKNYAGKAATFIVDAGGKGDYSTLQEAIDSLPSTSAGEILVKGGTYNLAQAVIIEDREDLVIKGLGKATELKVANKVQELIASNAASGQKNVIVADGSSFAVGQHVCVRDDSGNVRQYTSSAAVADNGGHLLVGVINPGDDSTELWVDGDLDGGASGTLGAITIDTVGLTFGCLNTTGGFSDYTVCYVDEPLILDRALSREEVYGLLTRDPPSGAARAGPDPEEDGGDEPGEEGQDQGGGAHRQVRSHHSSDGHLLRGAHRLGGDPHSSSGDMERGGLQRDHAGGGHHRGRRLGKTKWLKIFIYIFSYGSAQSYFFGGSLTKAMLIAMHSARAPVRRVQENVGLTL